MQFWGFFHKISYSSPRECSQHSLVAVGVGVGAISDRSLQMGQAQEVFHLPLVVHPNAERGFLDGGVPPIPQTESPGCTPACGV